MRPAFPVPPAPALSSVSPWRRWLAERPRAVLAVKTALAAALAWLAVREVGGSLAEYPWYAPLGAVVAVNETVASSARDATRAVVAVLIGAGLAFGVRLLDLPSPVALAVVVGVGTVLGGWTFLRDLGSWVPVSGLFVLLVGGGDPIHYPAAYLGLTAFGALVGIAVNLVFPPLPVLRTSSTEARLRGLLADQLEALADGLLSEEVLGREEWRRRHHDLLPRIHELEGVLAELNDARRANWRAARWREVTDRQHEQARALHQLSLLVEDVSSLIVHRAHLLRIEPEAGSSLLAPAGTTLQAMADLLRSLDGPTAEEEQLVVADEAVQQLATAIRENNAGSRQDGFVAASIATSVRRALASLTPDELADRIPSHW
ncbi:hypothetical protein [Nocardioides sp. zg-DK7169]|uniref:hypothetical protein n=1 Tax=Nocardioides sp. zg-DK7169 TaxID=2736600 RepID=UPI00155534DE|nr:hypothetical protein [Nocardioides sp. zg-DK7169]NPC98351.1 hypothetical protein [Nocardioides sp. zg-DK7169]